VPEAVLVQLVLAVVVAVQLLLVAAEDLGVLEALAF